MLRPRGNLCTGNLGNCAANPANTASTADHGPMLFAEQLVGEARSRRPTRMSRRETLVTVSSASAFMAVALGIALLLPSERPVDSAVVIGLVAGYALISRVRFEFGGYYVVPEQLMLVPMLLVAPLPLVPLLVAAGSLLSVVPDVVGGAWHRDRWLGAISDSWFALGPAIVLLALAPGPADLAHIEIYLGAFAAQMLFDFAWTVLRDRLLDRHPLREVVGNFLGTAHVETLLTPVAFAVGMLAAREPVALAAVLPLVWLLELFSRDRRARYSAALELQRAYRGTVMLLSDVVEADDPGTAHHSRSVVDLVNAVADEMSIDPRARQELEFAAMLHDVGKIAIPPHILHKPSSLSAEEYELMKTHTIEAQYMLDRVGGMLARVGEIVRSCHERWDGHGYPDGIAGTDIPLAARIVFVCDAYHAMTSDRVYRTAMAREDALAELAAHAGTQFDPAVTVALAKVVEQGEPAVSTAGEDVRRVLAEPGAAAAPRKVPIAL
jgi:HD-GYP domain-containing protein (c-di-GMP phosphodiesterase class II)